MRGVVRRMVGRGTIGQDNGGNTMVKQGKWAAAAAREEKPDHNRYTVEINAHGNHEAAARVIVDIYTLTFAVTQVEIERLQPDALKDTQDAELLKLAEIAVNQMPGLPMYVLLPGAAAQP
jgi:hypothetical protein